LDLFVRMGLALLIWLLINILINVFEASGAENEDKVSIDNDEDRLTFSLVERNPISDICVTQAPYPF
jgi:hypothetical protein